MINPYDIVKRVIVTEKSSILKDKHNKYVFEVNKNANKFQIKKAIEEIFKVRVKDVRTMNFWGKLKTYGRFRGYRPDWKKAVVTLEKGDTISWTEEL